MNYVEAALKVSELAKKTALNKTEAAELHQLSRALRVRGIDPASPNLLDLAILAENEKAVRSYIARSTGKEMLCAKKHRDKKAGRIAANALSAKDIRALGLSTSDPRRLSVMLGQIANTQRATDKLRKRSSHQNQRLRISESIAAALEEPPVTITREIDDDYDEKRLDQKIIDDINAYAEKEFA